jgi:hypothetical protein
VTVRIYVANTNRLTTRRAYIHNTLSLGTCSVQITPISDSKQKVHHLLALQRARSSTDMTHSCRHKAGMTRSNIEANNSVYQYPAIVRRLHVNSTINLIWKPELYALQHSEQCKRPNYLLIITNLSVISISCLNAYDCGYFPSRRTVGLLENREQSQTNASVKAKIFSCRARPMTQLCCISWIRHEFRSNCGWIRENNMKLISVKKNTFKQSYLHNKTHEWRRHMTCPQPCLLPFILPQKLSHIFCIKPLTVQQVKQHHIHTLCIM